MLDSPSPEDPLTFDPLRAAGIRDLERLFDGQWSDFNTHDPGITILEQVCWALTDLAYRLDHPIPDLLAEGGGDGARGLVPPAAALGCEPVTLADLRRLVLDVPGVANCWIEPDETPAPALYYHRDARTIATLSEPPETVPVRLQGLWRVRITAEDEVPGNLRREVAKRLYARRPLGQDFTDVDLLPTDPIEVRAAIEIEPVADPQALYASVLRALADAISPRVVFRGLQERLAAGTALEDILEGPCLTRGFVAATDLPDPRRPTAVYVSDLIGVLTGLPGVRVVRYLALRRIADTAWQDWILTLDPSRAPRLAREQTAEQVRLFRDRLPVLVDAQSALAALARSQTPRLADWDRSALEPALPTGRDRHIARYRSILQQFPPCYGVGPGTLPLAATPARRGQARQLQAYLQLFDQLLADAFAQAGNAGALLAGAAAPAYALGLIEDDGLGLDTLRAEPSSYRDDLGKAAAAAGFQTEDPALRRRQFDHLLARVGEVYSDPPLPAGSIPPGTDPARSAGQPGPAWNGTSWDGNGARRALLNALGGLAAARGTALDSLQRARPDNASGLARRIALKLGLNPDQGETFVLVEHILLRAIPGDEGQTEPLLRQATSPDPYSLQLSFVFPGDRGRFVRPEAGSGPADGLGMDFRSFVEDLISAETPAHLRAYVSWMDTGAAFDAFAAAWTSWHERRLATLQARYGISATET